MAAGMEYLGYDGGSEIYCPTEWSIPGTQQIWRDWTSEYGVGDQGLLNLHTALVNSCNTVFYELGYELDREDQNLLPGMAKAFGLGSPTGIPYMQETGGTVPDPGLEGRRNQRLLGDRRRNQSLDRSGVPRSHSTADGECLRHDSQWRLSAAALSRQQFLRSDREDDYRGWHPDRDRARARIGCRSGRDSERVARPDQQLMGSGIGDVSW